MKIIHNNITKEMLDEIMNDIIQLSIPDKRPVHMLIGNKGYGCLMKHCNDNNIELKHNYDKDTLMLEIL
jgi:hypothetical protein